MSFQTNMKSMIRWIIFLSILLGIVMVSFCSVAEETEIITGQETSPNYIPRDRDWETHSSRSVLNN